MAFRAPTLGLEIQVLIPGLILQLVVHIPAFLKALFKATANPPIFNSSSIIVSTDLAQVSVPSCFIVQFCAASLVWEPVGSQFVASATGNSNVTFIATGGSFWAGNVATSFSLTNFDTAQITEVTETNSFDFNSGSAPNVWVGFNAYQNPVTEQMSITVVTVASWPETMCMKISTQGGSQQTKNRQPPTLLTDCGILKHLTSRSSEKILILSFLRLGWKILQNSMGRMPERNHHF